jgi:hypothetical protein
MNQSLLTLFKLLCVFSVLGVAKADAGDVIAGKNTHKLTFFLFSRLYSLHPRLLTLIALVCQV